MIELVNFHKDKIRYKIDNLGSLYISKNWNSDIPTIFVGGQMEHFSQFIGQKSGLTKEPGYITFDGCFAYEYSINEKDKSIINAINFSNSLLRLLKESGIKRANLITESYGGTIGAYASKSKVIDTVVAVHPPVLGSPLAWENLLSFNMTIRQKIFAFLANIVVDSRYGFQKDNSKIIDLRLVDLNKFVVVGSNLDRQKDKNFIMKETYDVILAVAGMESDGVVIFNELEFNRLGINYIKEENPTNHEDASHKKAIEEAYNLTLNKK